MKLILIGCGGVGRTFLEMLPMTSYIPKKSYERVVIIEPRNLSDEPVLQLLNNAKINTEVVQIEITKKNIKSLMDKYIHNKDIVVDVSYNVAFQPLIKHCLKKSAHYINTSMERWPVVDEDKLEHDYYPRTLHYLHQIVKQMDKVNGSTCIVTHGMNPGLINHFTRLGIKHVAGLVLNKAAKNSIQNTNLDTLNTAFKNNDFPLMSYLLKLRTIHCSERDTQLTSHKQNNNEFVNTWGPYSFYAEGVDPVQIGWGNHEIFKKHTQVPVHHKTIINKPIDRDQVFFNNRGVDQLFHSYVPYIDQKGRLIKKDGSIIGMGIPHSENESTTRSLTLVDNNQNILYRPSAYYVYSPCKAAWKSIELVRNNKYKMLSNQVALRAPDIISGEDAVGSLLIFESNPIDQLLYNVTTKPVSLWSGTILSITQTKKLGLKYAGPTTTQVGISLLAAIKWMLKNPNSGICFPEDLNYKEILDDCIKDGWLGNIYCDFVPYQPAGTNIENFIV